MTWMGRGRGKGSVWVITEEEEKWKRQICLAFSGAKEDMVGEGGKAQSKTN